VKMTRGQTVDARRTAIAAAVCVFTSLAFFTSFHAKQSGQAPLFKSKIEIVQLDVSVLDKHRQPVRGLTERDFSILEDGKPQKIVGFSAFDMEDRAPPATGWMRAARDSGVSALGSALGRCRTS